MTDIDGRSLWSRDREPGPAGAATADASVLPEALVQEHARIVRSRSNARRVPACGRARRRVVPPLVAGSGALLSSTMIGAWVFGQAPNATAPTFAPMATTATTPPTPDQAQLNLDVSALARLRQALAADDAAISGLTSSAAATGSASVAQGGPSAGPGSSRGAPTGSATTPGVPGAGGAPGATATTVPPLAGLPGVLPAAPLSPLPTVPTVSSPTTTAPPTHTTTGATVAVP